MKIEPTRGSRSQVACYRDGRSYGRWGLGRSRAPGCLWWATTTLGVYLSRVYAAASVPDELLEAARIDGSGEVRTFESLAQA
jgi:ABC-type glycerol-3-phosphate transport system permease component